MKKIGLLLITIALLTSCTNNVVQSTNTEKQQTENLAIETTSKQNESQNTLKNSDENKENGIDGFAFALGNQIVNSPSFIGNPYLNPIIPNDDVYNFPQSNVVTFEAGSRSNWHRHGGMVILAVGGVGLYQEEGKPAQILRVGDVLEIPEDVKHWHGAMPNSDFQQIVIYDSHFSTKFTNEESVPVDDEYYNNLTMEEFTGRNKNQNGKFMFEVPDEYMTLETFTGPLKLSEVLNENNVAKAPGLHYVVFGDGVYNNWHTHEGGQILIATDGIGFHQMENGDVEVLYPGDVAFCPPGVKHWHGGSKGCEFAHIAINTNPQMTGLEWGDRINIEEYNFLNSEIKNTNKNGNRIISLSNFKNNNLDLVDNNSGSTNKNLVIYFDYSENIDTTGLDVDTISSASLRGGGTGRNLLNLKVMVDEIKNNIGADVYSMQVNEVYPAKFEDMTGIAREDQNNNKQFTFKTELKNLENYDNIFFGVPVWWAVLPQPVNVFFDKYDFSGKTIIPFGIHHGSGFGRMIQEMREHEKNAKVLDGFTIDADTDNDVVRNRFNEYLKSINTEFAPKTVQGFDSSEVLPDIPVAYKNVAKEQGKIEKFTYKTSAEDKYAYVYTPYGYNKNENYDIIYMLHGGGGSQESLFGGENQNNDIKNAIDNLIERKEIKPLIIVTPTFYTKKHSVKDVNGSWDAVKEFPEELSKYLIPAVEKEYSTYANTTNENDLINSRNHRAFGGFSMGSVTTWYVMQEYMRYFNLFIPISGDSWAVEMQGGRSKAKETINALNRSIENQRYSSNDFNIYAMTGTDDIAEPCMTPMFEEIKNNNTYFKLNDNTKYLVRNGGIHNMDYVKIYIFNMLKELYK